ncbi:MAG: hypothetical protein JWP81_3338 [Ferruginibacter sp.]|nr:hypothetical protein [Ferruginibacter sp.]
MKSHFLFRIGHVIFFIILISSCTPHFYKAKPLEPVLLTGQNEFKLNAITDFSMSSVSAAYSPKQNFGILAGVASNHYRSSATTAGRDTIYINEYVVNPYLGAGYYKNIAPNILFEVYSGIGMYNYKNTALSYLKSMNSLNFFLQPSIGYAQNNLDAIFTLRIDYLDRNKTKIKDSVLSVNNQKRYAFLEYKDYFFLQPGITLRAGTKNFKIQFQVSESIPFSGNYRSIYGYGAQLLVFNSFKNTNKILFSFGGTVELNSLFNKKK